MDLSGYTDVYLYFQHYFFSNYTLFSAAHVDYSIDGGDNWTALASWTSTTTNPNVYNQNVTVFVAGYNAVKFRWNYLAVFDEGFWAIDDIWITGTATQAPDANFYADETRPEVGQQVSLFDFSSNSPYSWNWTITPSTFTFLNGTGPTSQNPQVSLDTGGYYTVSLAATNAIGSDTATRNDYLYAETPGLWKGTVSSEWEAFSNWDNYSVPASDVA